MRGGTEGQGGVVNRTRFARRAWVRAGMAAAMLWLVASATAVGPAAAQQGLVGFERDRLVVQTSDGREHPFEIELATTPAQRSQGLMYRHSLAEDAGMLFIYPRSRTVSMWMRNTRIPLDMLFIAEDGEIARIEERTVPFSMATISSGARVRAVLEVNGGTVARLGIQPGDRVAYPAFETAP